MRSLRFIFRFVFAWAILLAFALMLAAAVLGPQRATYVAPIMPLTLFVMLLRAVAHVRRVRFLADNPGAATFGTRHRRRIEMPFAPAETFDMVEAAIRGLPGVESVESVRESLQFHARMKGDEPVVRFHARIGRDDAPDGKSGPSRQTGPARGRRNLVHATIVPGKDLCSLTVICETEGGAWADWFCLDDGASFANVEAITRAIARRIAERRKEEEAKARENATDKELAEAKLNLLQAQVEPHFLYNTLASAQLLTRSDPARADRMLGNLIAYLRASMPRTGQSLSTLGEELGRAQAYLEIMRIRMGDRLAVQVQVPEALKQTPLPAMMLQTLVENAVKHGLEPVPGGGTIWILARAEEGRVSLTVADDGRGFAEDGGGTGIGLKNVRERLRLAYGETAAFSIVSNFPRGVAATIAVPA